MEYGDRAEFLAQQAVTTGKVSKALLERPTLDQASADAADIFFTLHASRVYSDHGPECITVADIKAALDLYDITEIEDRLSYLRIIQSADMHYVTFMTDRINRMRKNGRNSKSQGLRRQQRR